MQKILVLHRYPPYEVTGTNASYLEFLKKLASEFNVYCLSYKSSSKVQDPSINGVEFFKLPYKFNRSNNFDKTIKTYLWIVLVPFYIRKLNRKLHLDLIYCDDSVPYYGFLTKIINPKIKVVIRLGDLQTGYMWADRNLFIFRLALIIESLMWKKVDGLVAISESFKKFLVRQGINENKIKVVKESINLEKNAQDISLVKDSGKIMFHGALVKCKGLETLLKAWKIFSEKHPNTKLIIAGGGPQEATLRHMANKLKLNNVDFKGWYDHQDLEILMREVQMAIVMRSPNMANNFVVTTCLLENWAYKKPVIVPNLASFREVVEENTNGLFFKPGDNKDLAEKMDHLYKNAETYDKLTQNGLETAEKIFSHRKIANDMVTALKSYLQER